MILPRMFAIICLLSTTTLFAQDETPVRPEWNAIRLPDGAITIDGRDDDWRRPGDALQRCELAPDTAKTWSVPDAGRGPYLGEADCSVTLHFAHDKDNFYVLADVRDQFLVNTASEESPHFGDDLELFIDANAPVDRFGTKYNENVRQYAFVAGYVNPKWSKAFNWQSDRRPAQVASRLQPWGYTMEIAIPKASFPYWKDHPELDAIGLEGFVSDADAPGVDISHPALKGAVCFGAYASHFSTAKQFALLRLEQEPVKLGPVSDDSAPIPAADLAHEVMALPGDRARMFLLAQQPGIELPPLDEFVKLVKQLAAKKDMESLATAQYGLMALARRQKMPVGEFKEVCLTNGDPNLALTYVWCCGINGDKSAVPMLIDLLKNDKNGRIQMMAALSLGVLGDPAAIEPLREAVGPRPDPKHGLSGQAIDALKKLGAPYDAQSATSVK